MLRSSISPVHRRLHIQPEINIPFAMDASFRMARHPDGAVLLSISRRRMGSGCQSGLPQMTGAGLIKTDRPDAASDPFVPVSDKFRNSSRNLRLPASQTREKHRRIVSWTIAPRREWVAGT